MPLPGAAPAAARPRIFYYVIELERRNVAAGGGDGAAEPGDSDDGDLYDWYVPAAEPHVSALSMPCIDAKYAASAAA